MLKTKHLFFFLQERKYPHIGPQHLVEICSRISPMLERESVPAVAGVLSLLGAGRQSLLRTKESIAQPKKLIDHCTRLHNMPPMESLIRKSSNNIGKEINVS